MIYIAENATPEDMKKAANIQAAEELTVELHDKLARVIMTTFLENPNKKIHSAALMKALAAIIFNFKGHEIAAANHIRDYVVEWVERHKDDEK